MAVFFHIAHLIKLGKKFDRWYDLLWMQKTEKSFGGLIEKMGYLIKDTTKEEREAIVAESLGNIEGSCDGCAAGLAEMYQDYIDGKKELKEINMEFRRGYISGEEVPTRSGCGIL